MKIANQSNTVGMLRMFAMVGLLNQAGMQIYQRQTQLLNDLLRQMQSMINKDKELTTAIKLIRIVPEIVKVRVLGMNIENMQQEIDRLQAEAKAWEDAFNELNADLLQKMIESEGGKKPPPAAEPSPIYMRPPGYTTPFPINATEWEKFEQDVQFRALNPQLNLLMPMPPNRPLP
jgi:hypothetical protein